MEQLKIAAKNALRALEQAGATRAAVTATQTKTTEFNMADGEFTLLRTLHDDALALTGFDGGRKGTIGLNRFDEGSVAEAAQSCMASARTAEDDPAWEIASEGAGSFTGGAPEADVARFFERSRELLAQIAERHPTILVEQMVLAHRGVKTVYENSNGVRYEAVSGEYEIYMSVCARDGEDCSAMAGTGVVTASLDKPFLDLGTVERDLRLAERQLRAEPYAGKGVLPVVIAPDCFEALLGSLLGNFCGDEAILSGTSAWKDKLGTLVADPRLTVTIAARAPELVPAEHWTSEGFPAENYDVIHEGKLGSFLISQYVANRTGLARAKNSGGAFVVAPGEKSLDELMAAIGTGLYVGRFSGGAPASNGDFSGVAKNSFLIENGALGRAVSEVMISGNLADVLTHLRGLSRERAENGTSALPWVAADGVTVSGK